MVTVYGYITLADLEKFTGLDYSAIDTTAFADANVEAMITTAERIVNGYYGVSTGQTKTDGVISAVTIISAKILQQNMTVMGYSAEGVILEDIVSWTIREILKFFLDSDQSISVDTIPMSGANDNIVFSW